MSAFEPDGNFSYFPIKQYPRISLALELLVNKNDPYLLEVDMKQLIALTVAGFVFFFTLSPALAARAPRPVPGQQQVPTPQGFSTLLCLADALLGGAELPGESIILFGGQVILQATSGVATSNGVSTINVRIIHGKSSSEHTVTFIDDGSGTLDCGDTIISVA